MTMIHTVVSIPFPAEERFRIRKHRMLPDGYTEESDLSGLRRFSIVTGIHGDELEGQYVCYQTARRVREQSGCLQGIVDIYPALNPLGMRFRSEPDGLHRHVVAAGSPAEGTRIADLALGEDAW
ncbi:MAG: succinylglutamate desuccinylase/aspartoacylase family protein, partial [Mogibacterium sp.]|nr:succinylglutamate desuccinylase/aspartoacylase family protein [Mogibacterium sp.]